MPLNLGPLPPVVARCDQCRNGFVYAPPDATPGPCPYAPCAGTVRYLDGPMCLRCRAKGCEACSGTGVDLTAEKEKP